MHFRSRVTWSLLLSLISLGIVADAADSGIIEVDLLFPRNETYAPTEWMPFVFSIRNGELSKHLNPFLRYRGWNTSDLGAHGFTFRNEKLKFANWSSQNPYFVYNFRNDLQSEGTWWLDWEFYFLSCNEDFTSVLDPGAPVFLNNTFRRITFTIKEGGQPVDLVAATANDKTCSEQNIAAINVTGKTQDAPLSGDELPDDICAVVGSPEPSAIPCQVKVDSAVAASMTASLRDRLCDPLRTIDRPDDCPEDSAAMRLAVAGVACLAAAVGMLGFFA
ncbi:hypothetical protein QBC32DRAFT_352734 [Pseudoneurospora amorphoporcata]|uniref:DUF7136 domain-containing protein n=1 Tax=Pseudoneurospora amorphoporcata TaxID=241081 RepID=A0AAN6SBC0_9PEZI|nr:hypothetical protein QBC32DRAFT_352734 [Pseudoneurospora amorphoporcata]